MPGTAATNRANTLKHENKKDEEDDHPKREKRFADKEAIVLPSCRKEKALLNEKVRISG